MVSPAAYSRIIEHFRGKDWEIVGFDQSRLILRIERENIEFDRQRGTIKGRFSL